MCWKLGNSAAVLALLDTGKQECYGGPSPFSKANLIIVNREKRLSLKLLLCGVPQDCTHSIPNS